MTLPSIIQETVKQYNLSSDKIPRHIAVIMDGNGRWAKARKKPRTDGHKAGRTALKLALKNCAKLGVQHLTAYTFSTENWSRPRSEINALMSQAATGAAASGFPWQA